MTPLKWCALWLLWAAVIIGVTTTPWSDFQGHTHWGKVRWIPFQDDPFATWDILENIVLFVPFGFFYARSKLGVGKRALLNAVLMAAALSASVELFQSFGHTRIPSATDVCNNVFGALCGAALANYMKGIRPHARV